MHTSFASQSAGVVQFATYDTREVIISKPEVLISDTFLSFAVRRLGNRDAANAWAFIGDVSDRLRHRVQLTTDGNKLYVERTGRANGFATVRAVGSNSLASGLSLPMPALRLNGVRLLCRNKDRNETP